MMSKIIAVVIVLGVVGVGLFFVLRGGESDDTPQEAETTATVAPEQRTITEEPEEDRGTDGSSPEILNLSSVVEYSSFCPVFNTDNFGSLFGISSWENLVDIDMQYVWETISVPSEVGDYHNVAVESWRNLVEYAKAQPGTDALDYEADVIQDMNSALYSVAQQLDTDTLQALTEGGCIPTITS